MKLFPLFAACAGLATLVSAAHSEDAVPPLTASELVFSIDNMDMTVDPRKDFHRYAAGTWLKTAVRPERAAMVTQRLPAVRPPAPQAEPNVLVDSPLPANQPALLDSEFTSALRHLAATEAGLVEGGIAIDENTAFIVGEGALRAVGTGNVWQVLPVEAGVRVSSLAAG